jgi:alpha/beta superfamily hydrolase
MVNTIASPQEKAVRGEGVVIPSGVLSLEGLYRGGTGGRGVVVTHPHPLYGGDMDNPVVESLAAVYHRAGYATLRFNFRGVGRSTGRYSDGTGEMDDLAAAMTWLAGQGLNEISLAGYSFGAWVAAGLAIHRLALGHLAMISPPVAFMDFSQVGALPALALVVTGRLDTFAPPDPVKSHMATWNPDARYHELPHADHFYWGQFTNWNPFSPIFSLGDVVDKRILAASSRLVSAMPLSLYTFVNNVP